MSNAIEVKNLVIWDERNGEELVHDLSFELPAHSCLAIVGESGSGKSMTVKTISGIHKPWIRSSGSILFHGIDLLKCSKEQMRKIRGKEIFMIFQDGMSAFDPSLTLIKTLREIYMDNILCTKAQADAAIYAAAETVMLKSPKETLNKYPHQLSGGMLQRIMIAIALALQAEVIIADEPTTSLDTITQYEIINEFSRIKKENGNTMIFISHDLGVVRKISDYVVVMQHGKKVEEGAAEDIFLHPQQEYTRYLVNTRMALGENYKKLFGVCQNA